jgi:hypothetical protein
MQGANLAANKEVLATQLINLGKEIADLSMKVKDRQISRLERVTIPQIKQETKSPVLPAETWPPLLSELRQIFWDIRRALDIMDETLNRLEI